MGAAWRLTGPSLRDLFARGGRAPATNPFPALPPSTPYPCGARDARWVGRSIPGRRGGTVSACATPSRERPREGQVWVGLGALGTPLRKSTARRRLAARGRTRADDALSVELAAEQIARTGLPQPTGLEFPHVVGSSRCDPEHPVWAGFAEALEAGDERAALTDDEGAVRAALEAHPSFASWRDAADACMRGAFERRANQRKAADSGTRQAARARADAVRGGVDTTSAEYLDTLTPGSRAAALRRLGRRGEAREIEQDMRRRRKRGK